MNPGRTRALLLVAIAMAGPAALGFDLLARRFVLGGQPDDVKQWMAEQVTHYAWFVVPLPLLGGLAGFFVYRSIVARSRKKQPTPPPAELEKAELGALLLATTMAQAPALFGDLSVMLGARLTPGLCTTAISVTMVLAIGLFARSRAQ